MKKLKDGFQGERQIVLPPMVVEQEESDSLASSLFVTDIGYYPRAAHHYRSRSTPIEQYVLIYCVDGSGWYVLGGRRYVVQKGHFFVLPPHVPHAYGATENGSWTIYWVHFSGSHAGIYAEGMQVPQQINVELNSRIMERLGIFEEILTTLETGTDIEALRYASSLLHHFLASMRYLRLFREAKHSSDTGSGAADSPDAAAICQAAVHYMEENIESHITLQQVLDYTGYSQSHFSALFKRHTGKSPLVFFNGLKMERAGQLLRETDLQVNQICHKVGIDDPYYFSRLFSKAMGMSPTSYRTKMVSDIG